MGISRSILKLNSLLKTLSSQANNLLSLGNVSPLALDTAVYHRRAQNPFSVAFNWSHWILPKVLNPGKYPIPADCWL